MNKRITYTTYFSVWLYIIPFHFFFGQEKIKTDSSTVTVEYFKDGIKDRYNGDDFNYNINDSGGVNLIQDIFRKFFRWLGDLFGIDIDFIDYQTMEYIVYGLLALGSIYLLFKFFLQAPLSTVFKTEEQSIENFKYVEENITEVNFDALIKKALKDSNYRLATRYLYLASLKKLTSKNVIEWHYDKTNSDYLNEIQDVTIKGYFKRISYIYDYVWYGEFSIDQSAFNKNQEDFNKLNKVLNG